MTQGPGFSAFPIPVEDRFGLSDLVARYLATPSQEPSGQAHEGQKAARARYIPVTMTRIAVTQAAFEAIVATMPFDNEGYEPQRDPRGCY